MPLLYSVTLLQSNIYLCSILKQINMGNKYLIGMIYRIIDSNFSITIKYLKKEYRHEYDKRKPIARKNY